MGPEFMKEMRAQAERFGTEFLTGDVTAVALAQRPFTLTIDGEQTVKPRPSSSPPAHQPFRSG